MRAETSTASGALNKRAPEARVRYSQVLLLKRSGPEPLYYQLAQSVEKAVEAGRISHGTRLLPESEMAREMNVAVSTVRTAWAYLESKGLLTRGRYRGTTIQ